MRVRKLTLLATAAALWVPATAQADFSHIVEPGETLTSIAAADGLSLGALAAANGLSVDSELRIGQVVEIPPLDLYTASAGPGAAARSDAAAAATAAPASAGAGSGSEGQGGAYVVQPGDTLSAIAARAGLSVGRLAALNGLSVDHVLLAGTRLTLGAGSASATTADAGAGDTADGAGDTADGGGTYVVQPGDSLSAIAARAGVSVARLAALNGLDPDGVLLIGTTLTLPAGGAGAGSDLSAGSAGASASAGAGPATGAGNQQIPGDTSGGPYPTDQTVSGAEIGAEAAAGGLDPALAEAVGWQESGFDNDLVSPTGAVGVMQIEPATWAWINQVLSPSPLDPSSAYDNVRGGVMLLHDLVARTGSETLATAAYYQGLESLEQHGMYASTRQYVNDVFALQLRFGG